ncbi:hypothetical protein FOL47_006156 [Perkinsus chesapeaki]|uniref:Uncharacterized protein n=1 Tax=Perkinsus chesapeaki TaxID=330153 RepID=A0A7J6LTY6_PERCH|nr:hypothetical protein FOL47_006156 [Perkinsus chesapeaki]
MLDKKTHDDIFCVHATLDTRDGLHYVDVLGSLAGINLVQKKAEAVDLHISGGGSAVVFSTDGEVRLDATAKLEILDGGNPRHYSGVVEIACGYVLSGEVSLKAAKTELLSATFGGTGVVGGGKDNLLGNYIPLESGLDALVAGFLVKGTPVSSRSSIVRL